MTHTSFHRRWAWVGAGLVLLIAVGAVSAAVFRLRAQRRAPVYEVSVVARYPHDPKAFSQGLVIHKGQLFEGTGQEGESQLRKVDLKTGKVTTYVPLPKSVFGEGITVFKDKIYQLTWHREVAYVYDLKSMKYQKSLRYRGEGWGLTHNDKHLIMSNGSSTLQFMNPQTFRPVRTIRVRDGNRPIRELNELEYINGEIFANVWHEDRIARIDPKTGRVKSWLNLKKLRPPSVRYNDEAVLNGIAWDKDKKKLYVTGKDWPLLYEIRINSRPNSSLTGRP